MGIRSRAPGRLFLAVFLAMILPALHGEDFRFRLGMGLEGNMNTDYGMALGRSVMVDMKVFKYVVPGVMVTISDDFRKFTSIEPEILARWYCFPMFEEGGAYVQADIGMNFALKQGGDFTPRFLGGVTTGFRYPFMDGDYYVEPYMRTGYPFLWSIGARAGCRF